MVSIPKRNKSNDNPYILGFDEESKNYTVEFVDNRKVLHRVEISQKIYEAFDNFELEDVSQIHKFQRHIEHSEIYEETLLHRSSIKTLSVEEEVENKIMYDELKCAIDLLSESEKRRLKKYYFEDKTESEIAYEEGTTQQAIHKSLKVAREKLKEILKN